MGRKPSPPLTIAIIGAGLGGLTTAIGLRRAGYHVTIYERDHQHYELGSGIGIVSNGGKWLEGEWGVDMKRAHSLVCTTTTIRHWETGKILMQVPVGDYKGRFGHAYYMAYRADLHGALLEEVLKDEDAEGKLGPKCLLKQDWRCVGVDAEKGTVRFTNGEEVKADLIVGADGIHSKVRESIGIIPETKPSDSVCYRWIIPTERVRSLGLGHLCDNPGLTFWGGKGFEKVVAGPCHDGELITGYCFYPASKNDLREDGWNIESSREQLAGQFRNLDPQARTMLLNADDIKIWRLFEHKPYPYREKGSVALMGDAAGPYMPDQNQGYSMAVEDAAALSLVFSQHFFQQVGSDMRKALELYQELRQERTRTVAEKSLKARTDITERFGFKTPNDPPGKLTVEWLCEYDMKKHLQDLIDGKR